MPSTLERLALPHDVDEAILDRTRRQALLDAAYERRSGRERPGQFWKIDLDALDFSSLKPAPWSLPQIAANAAGGLIACDLATAAREHNALFKQFFGAASAASSNCF